MSHRTALLASLMVTLLMAAGVVAGRDRFFGAPAAPEAASVQPAGVAVAETVDPAPAVVREVQPAAVEAAPALVADSTAEDRAERDRARRDRREARAARDGSSWQGEDDDHENHGNHEHEDDEHEGGEHDDWN